GWSREVGTGGMLSGEQNVEQDSKGEDVRGGRDGPAGELLGSGVLGGERRLPLAGRGLDGRRRVRVEKLRDPEIEQPDAAVLAHQDVRRLQIAVHDQMGVSERDGGKNLEKKAEAPGHGKSPRVAEDVD